MDILNIQNLHKSFGDKKVLNGLSFSVPRGSIFGFVGKNGAGKTTTMKAVLGLLKPEEGEITLCGERVCYGQTPTNRFVGYLPDVPEFYGFVSPMEYLRLCGQSLGMEKAQLEERSRALLGLVGLREEKHPIRGFSRGMKQRLGIAQALLHRPKLLICDEPTSALDPLGRKEILDILLSVKEETTVLFSTHILSDVERICTHLALLNGGQIALEGTVESLKQTYAPEGFTLEGSELSQIQAAFPQARAAGENALFLPGGEEALLALYAFLSAQKISLKKIEQAEPSLEALFMEVTK